MLAPEYMPYVRVAANLVIFVLFCIKFRGFIEGMVLPYLRSYRQELEQHWFALQEKHLVLVSKKKQLATQFLQQEKQIALLTAKLESWRLVCAHKQQEHENALAERGQAMNRRAARQQHVMAQNKLVADTAKIVMGDVLQNASNQPELFFEQYVGRAAEHLSQVAKKEVTYESPHPKKAKSA